MLCYSGSSFVTYGDTCKMTLTIKETEETKIKQNWY